MKAWAGNTRDGFMEVVKVLLDLEGWLNSSEWWEMEEDLWLSLVLFDIRTIAIPSIGCWMTQAFTQWMYLGNGV